ncbi:aminotransferase class I/II-fold pyridoxal phosphate-dependent enzyme [Sphingomonas daechungensis]|nr:aminotransferase class I/II-fold pyridoxal phosphate-dependent enzyme [Sphingomonas daechungensis]
MIRRAGATPREVALTPPEWRIDADALETAVTDRTKAVIFNNPHNPTGRLFAGDELQIVADFANRHDFTVISDEVWEHILLHGDRFTPLAMLPGMADRTLKAGSAGKIFSLTGWKVGWIVASPAKAAITARAHQFLTFSTAPSLQSAVAYGLTEGDAWIEPMRGRFSRALNRMSEGLRQAGYVVLEPASTYFLCVDLEASGIEVDDETFANAAVERAGVATIPVSAFAEDNPSRHLVRLCFAKRDETIDAGVQAMARARELFA